MRIYARDSDLLRQCQEALYVTIGAVLRYVESSDDGRMIWQLHCPLYAARQLG